MTYREVYIIIYIDPKYPRFLNELIECGKRLEFETEDKALLKLVEFKDTGKKDFAFFPQRVFITEEKIEKFLVSLCLTRYFVRTVYFGDIKGYSIIDLGGIQNAELFDDEDLSKIQRFFPLLTFKKVFPS